MNLIIVDDEPWILENMKEMCCEMSEISTIAAFVNPLLALDYIQNKAVDLAILDIRMPIMNGLQLGEKIKEYNPDISIIYTTGYEEYALDSYKLHALAYIMKPCSKNELQYAIETARKLIPRITCNIYIKTFGRFDIFVDNKPIVFRRAKAKELLALLIDQRGGVVTMDNAIDILWNDKLYSSNVKQMYRDAVSQLRKTLLEYNCSNILYTVRAGCFLDTNKFKCDFYDLMNGDKTQILNFNDVYMFDYSWAEYTLPLIHKKIQNLDSTNGIATPLPTYGATTERQ